MAGIIKFESDPQHTSHDMSKRDLKRILIVQNNPLDINGGPQNIFVGVLKSSKYK